MQFSMYMYLHITDHGQKSSLNQHPLYYETNNNKIQGETSVIRPSIIQISNSVYMFLLL